MGARQVRLISSKVVDVPCANCTCPVYVPGLKNGNGGETDMVAESGVPRPELGVTAIQAAKASTAEVQAPLLPLEASATVWGAGRSPPST
jgi:hypothetical protein